ncbi:YvrJ family protein [Clostridiaceae bacterium UIB06]|nr:YvrJ family protein [Clostridiaceae bacterium UIB06]
MNADLLATIGNMGFPIAVSVYLLVRFEGKLEALTLSINDLSTTIKNLLVNSGVK